MTLYRPNENMTFEAGEILYVTSGEYSSYGVSFIARVVVAFNARDFVKKEHTEERLDTQRLLDGGFMVEIDARELYTGGN